LPDVGHYVPEEASAAFARFVQIFLDDTAHSVRS
jgi:hypothetical protein